MAKQNEFIRGTAVHRRTETDYMSALLDTVTLDDWRDVVSRTVKAAKEGDPAARDWLARYLIGKPESKAPTPLTVVVQQLSGCDPVADGLAQPLINRTLYPALHEDNALVDDIRARVAAELARKLTGPKMHGTPPTVGDSPDSVEKR